MTVSGHIYTAAGRPPMDGGAAGRCRLCGADGAGVPFGAWVKDTFTDHDKIAPGQIVCHACQFCSSEATPGLAERVGKDKAQKFRNYSHIVVGGAWHPLSKGDKATMRALLCAGPDVALIATSGQKHLFFRAPPGWWQVEEIAMRPDPAGLTAALTLVTPLLATFAKGEIETGRYDQRRILAYGVPAWRAAETTIRGLRGGALLDLALFLAQREVDTDGA